MPTRSHSRIPVRPTWWTTGLVVLVSMASPARVHACAPCESGDPTLSVMGAAVPFQGRVRAGTQLRVAWQHAEPVGGRGGLRTQADLSLAVAVSPIDRLTLSLDAPLTLVDVTRPNLSASTTLGPGDLSLRVRGLVLRDRRFAPEHRLSVTAGLRAPTSIDQVDGAAERLPFDAQTGGGAFAPLAALTYVHAGDPLTLLVHAEVAWPLGGRYDWTLGPSAQLTVAPQLALADWVSARAAAGLRVEAPAEGAQRTVDGLAVLSVSPELLFRPEMDWLIRVGVQVPVWQSDASLGLRGGAAVYAGVAVDLGGAS